MTKNKYYKKYFSLLEKVKTRGWKRYKNRVRYYINPEILGGKNEKDDIVYISHREHFICYLLLSKMTKGKKKTKILETLESMKSECKLENNTITKITSRVYEKYKLKKHLEKQQKILDYREVWNKGRKLEGIELEKQRERIHNRKINSLKLTPNQQKKVEKILLIKQSKKNKIKKNLKLKRKLTEPISIAEKVKQSIKIKDIPQVNTQETNISNTIKSIITINKEGIEKKVKKDTLQSYLDMGWQLGGKKRKVNI